MCSFFKKELDDQAICLAVSASFVGVVNEWI